MSACASGRTTLACTLAGHASCRAPYEALTELRRQPGTLPAQMRGGEPLPANFLKQSDEQTVIALAAVLEAIRAHALAPPGQAAPFRDWGVLAAPRFLGRPTLTAALPRFQNEGAWGVSPHVIPHRSLHSLSGTISQALQIHGPNYGVGGGPGSELEGLIAAVVMLHDMQLPGVWLVLSRLEPEGDCDQATGRPAPDTMLRGLALALLPPGTLPDRPVLELVLAPSVPGKTNGQAIPPGPGLDELETLLAEQQRPTGPGCAVSSLGGLGRLVLRRPTACRSGYEQPLLTGPHPSFFTPGAIAFAPQRSDQS